MTDRDKALAALKELFKLTEEPKAVELYTTIRQALTPQSSADLGAVRWFVEAFIGSKVMQEEPEPTLDDAKEALAILDQQAVQSLLTALRARVEGMKTDVKTARSVYKADSLHHAEIVADRERIIDSVLRTIDEVIGRAD